MFARSLIVASVVLALGGAMLPFLGQSRAAGEEPRRRPVFDISRIDALSDVSPAERTRRVLGFFREEIANPSGTYDAFEPGGVIDHGYILATMALLLVERGADIEVLRAEFQRTGPGEYRTIIGLTLGLLGDRSMVQPLAEFFADPRHHKELRHVAARGLEKMPDRRVIPYAVHVLAADTTVQLTYKRDPRTRKTLDPVYELVARKWALGVLQAIEKAGIPLDSRVQALMRQAVLEIPVPQQQK